MKGDHKLLTSGHVGDYAGAPCFSPDARYAAATLLDGKSRKSPSQSGAPLTYVFLTQSWTILHAIPQAHGMHAHLGFTPWPMGLGGEPCFYYAAQYKVSEPETKTVTGCAFVSLDDWSLKYWRGANPDQLWVGGAGKFRCHPHQRVIVSNERFDCCDPRASVVACHIKHEKEVESLALSLDGRRLALATKSSDSGAQVLVVDVLTNTTLYSTTGPRADINWEARNVLRVATGWSSIVYVVFGEDWRQPAHVISVDRGSRGTGTCPWGDTMVFSADGSFVQLIRRRYQKEVPICTVSVLLDECAAELTDGQALAELTDEQVLKAVNAACVARLTKNNDSHGFDFVLAGKPPRQRLILTSIFPGSVAVYDATAIIERCAALGKVGASALEEPLDWRSDFEKLYSHEYSPKSADSFDVNLQLTSGSKLLLHNRQSRTCHVYDLEPLIVLDRDAGEALPKVSEVHSFSDVEAVSYVQGTHASIRLVSRTESDKKANFGGKLAYVDALNGESLWEYSALAWAGGSDGSFGRATAVPPRTIGGTYGGIDTKLDLLVYVVADAEGEEGAKLCSFVNLDALRCWGVGNPRDATELIAGVSKFLRESQAADKPDVLLHPLAQAQPHLVNLDVAGAGAPPKTLLHTCVERDELGLVSLLLSGSCCLSLTPAILECASPSPSMTKALFEALPRCSTYTRTARTARHALSDALAPLVREHPALAVDVLTSLGLEEAVCATGSLVTVARAALTRGGVTTVGASLPCNISFYDELTPLSRAPFVASGKADSVEARARIVAFPALAQDLLFLEALVGSTDALQVFDVPMVSLVLDHIWHSSAIWQYRASVAVFAVHVAAILAFTSSVDNEAVARVSSAVALLTSGCLVRGELKQLARSGLNYFFELWNLIQLVELGALLPCILPVVASSLGLPLPAALHPTALYPYLGALASFTAVVHAIALMRAFEKFGSLIRMVQQVASDLLIFLLFQLIVMFAFSWAYYILHTASPTLLALEAPGGVTGGPRRGLHGPAISHNDNGLDDDDLLALDAEGLAMDFPTSFMIFLRLLLGSFEMADWDRPAELTLFILYEVLVTVIMLNLLISIISDTHENVRDNEDRSSRAQRASLILDLETAGLLPRRAIVWLTGEDTSTESWLHVLEPQSSATDGSSLLGQADRAWTGQLSAIKDHVERHAASALTEAKAANKLSLTLESKLTQMRNDHARTTLAIEGVKEQQQTLVDAVGELSKRLGELLESNQASQEKPQLLVPGGSARSQLGVAEGSPMLRLVGALGRSGT